MKRVDYIDATMYAQMVRAGALHLQKAEQEINDLNVFPIPDGDTGSNMLLTILGGVLPCQKDTTLAHMASEVSRGMLLSARGNSGVILSQFFGGVSRGFESLDKADTKALGDAFTAGVKQAYDAVMTPTEGTILTVAREATAYACEQHLNDIGGFLDAFLYSAKESLEHTPELLPVLKRAGVVDSGGAGLIYIVEGMRAAVMGEDIEALPKSTTPQAEEINYDAFGADSVLTYGYCTELLLRLQNAKVDVARFDMAGLISYLHTIGDSVVAVQNDSIVKLHVHTMTPHKVLAYCQNFGEFLKVKIENMSLQHNSITSPTTQTQEMKDYGVVVVSTGDGWRDMFLERGADVVVEGGQSMNPSAEDFLKAFDALPARNILVYPNNSNIILTARQAAQMYESANVYVIPSHSVGEGYASLAMLDPLVEDADTLVDLLTDAMQGVETVMVSRCVRNACMDDHEMHTGDYIGIKGKEVLASSPCRLDAMKQTVDAVNLKSYDICMVICGKDGDMDEAQALATHIHAQYVGKEVYVLDGGQEIYDYILVVE